MIQAKAAFYHQYKYAHELREENIKRLIRENLVQKYSPFQLTSRVKMTQFPALNSEHSFTISLFKATFFSGFEKSQVFKKP